MFTYLSLFFSTSSGVQLILSFSGFNPDFIATLQCTKRQQLQYPSASVKMILHAGVLTIHDYII